MIPHALDRVAEWSAARRQAGRMLLALDFDGTLAPIVPRPEDATVLPETRAAINALAGRADMRVAIVSGRGLEDARARVGLPGLYYAGNHGMEIEGPGLRRIHEAAERARPALVACLERLAPLAGEHAGLQLEDKGLSLSVHYRRVADPDDAKRIVARVLDLCGTRTGLRPTEGKKVIEIRPDADWDKGRALLFLVDELLGDVPGPVVFVGDDRTDEDAFVAITGRGEGVIVADPPPSATAAVSYVRSPDEVAVLLAALADS